MSAVRLSFLDGVFWPHDSGGTHIALPLATHAELVALLAECRWPVENSVVGSDVSLTDEARAALLARLDKSLAALGGGGNTNTDGGSREG